MARRGGVGCWIVALGLFLAVTGGSLLILAGVIAFSPEQLEGYQPAPPALRRAVAAATALVGAGELRVAGRLLRQRGRALPTAR